MNEVAVQALGSYRQVSVLLVPKHNALLASTKCQWATCKILTLVKTSALPSEPVSWMRPKTSCGPLLFPRNSISSFVLMSCWLQHPLQQGGGQKTTEEKLSSAQWMSMYCYNTLHLQSLLFLFLFPLLPLFLPLCSLFSASGLSQVIWIQCKYLSVVPYLQFIIYCAVHFIVNTDCSKGQVMCLFNELPLTDSEQIFQNITISKEQCSSRFFYYIPLLPEVCNKNIVQQEKKN